MNIYPVTLFLLLLSPVIAPAATLTETAKLNAAIKYPNSPYYATKAFGFSVSVSGDTVVIGAPVNGRTYAFSPAPDGTWQQQARLDDRVVKRWTDGPILSGYSVALHGDTAAFGAPKDEPAYADPTAGRVFVITRDASVTPNEIRGQWNRVSDLTDDVDTGDADYFGSALALEGDTLVVGASGKGYIYVFERNEQGEWTQTAKLRPAEYELFNGTSSDTEFGHTVALSGDTILAGFEHVAEFGSLAYASVFVYQRDASGVWRETTQLIPNAPNLDGSWSIALDGDTALLASGETGVYVYDRDNNGHWSKNATLAESEVRSAGYSAIFDGYTTKKVFDGYSPNKVAISNNNALIAVETDTGDEAVNWYARDHQGIWRQQGKLVASDGFVGQHFGDAIAISNNLVVVGAFGDTNEFGIGTGAAYVFELPMAPQCNGHDATIYVDKSRIVGGPMDGQKYKGVLLGTAFDDVMLGTRYKNIIRGRGGDDVICGRDGHDRLFGGDGDDLLFGGDGHDFIKGQDGDDQLYGQQGKDILHGGRGIDRLNGGIDNDRCYRGETVKGCEIVR